MKKQQYLQLGIRTVVSLVGFFLCAAGMALSARIELGTPPFTSFPYVISEAGSRTLGFYVSSLYLLYIGMQILILRKDFKPMAFLQIGASVILGWFVDVWEVIFRGLELPNYFSRLVFLVISILMIALGVSVYLEPELMPVPVDGLITVIAQKLKVPYGKVKVIHDTVLTFSSILLSLILFGEIKGVREGTVITALFLGRIIAAMKKYLCPPLHDLCFGKETVK